jgi:ADP-heptose:LPS heptosyltransferase
MGRTLSGIHLTRLKNTGHAALALHSLPYRANGFEAMKTLLIFKVNQLGDNVVFLPLVQSLFARLSDWKIRLVTSPVAAPLYRTTLPQIELIVHETGPFNRAWRHPAWLAALIREFRRHPADTCLLGNDQGNVAHLLSRVTGASLCVGPHIPGRWLGPLLHERVPGVPDESAAMQNWQLGQRLLATLGQPALTARPPAPDLSGFGKADHGAILIHPGASRPYQRWPLERFVELANHLSESQATLWIHQGHEAEKRLAPAVARVTPGSLPEFIRCLAGARLFVGNNSGPMHLASALGVPGVIPSGPSSFNWDPEWHRDRFDLLREPLLPCQPCDKPAGPVGRCLNRDQPMACLERWSVTSVHQRVMGRLKESGTP